MSWLSKLFRFFGFGRDKDQDSTKDRDHRDQPDTPDPESAPDPAAPQPPPAPRPKPPHREAEADDSGADDIAADDTGLAAAPAAARELAFAGAMTQRTIQDLSVMLDLPEPEQLWAVIVVETNGAGFLSNRNPKVLYERHWFSRLTNKQFDGTAPKDVSSPQPFKFNSGAPEDRYVAGQANYDRIFQAAQYDHEAALKSTSWGLGQIMGFNYDQAGFLSVEEMVSAMRRSEDAQLTAMARFIGNDSRMVKALQQRQWADFAKIYNGPNYKNNSYDIKLHNAYESTKAGDGLDLLVRAAQLYLNYLGVSLAVDGIMGPATRTKVKQYQQSRNLWATGDVDQELVEHLERDVAELGAPDEWNLPGF